VIQKHPQPLFLFIQGLEILEIYLDPHRVYYWLLKILEEFTSLSKPGIMRIRENLYENRASIFFDSRRNDQSKDDAIFGDNC